MYKRVYINKKNNECNNIILSVVKSPQKSYLSESKERWDITW